MPDRFWRFPAFRTGNAPHPISEQIKLLGKEEAQLTDAESLRRQALLNALSALRRNPFQPYAAARAINVRAFQWQAVMKYLDNMIAWGDYYFTQDTMETIEVISSRFGGPGRTDANGWPIPQPPSPEGHPEKSGPSAARKIADALDTITTIGKSNPDLVRAVMDMREQE